MFREPGSMPVLAAPASRQRPSAIAYARNSLPLRSTIVVETCRACASGNGPSETTHAPIARMERKTIANAAAASRTTRRFLTPSWPGLSRPSTSLPLTPKGADGRDIWRADGASRLLPGHDEVIFLLGALIS